MGRKKVADMSSEELEKYRKYMSQKKRESRARRDTKEIDNRTYEDRADYLREYQRNYQREYYKKRKKIKEKC